MDPGKEEQENEEKMELSQGVLSQLWALEQRAAQGAALRQRQRRRRERQQLLSSRIRELRQRRDRLRLRLRDLRQQLLSSRIRELRQRRDRLRLRLRDLAEGKAGIPWEPGQVLQWRIRELQELLRLFPLTGVSAKLSRHGLSVSFHTSFEGSYLDCFHLELQGSRECRNSREFRVLRHSIPPFIPLQGLARELLPHSPRRFLALLARLLGAFVARRHQLHLLQGIWGSLLPHSPWRFLALLARLLGAFMARRHQLHLLQEEFSGWLRGPPCSNSLCNLLSFHCRIPAGKPQNPGIPRQNPEIPGKNPKNPEKNPKNPEENSEIPEENPEICGKNPKICGKNPKISGKTPENCGENFGISGKKPKISGKNPKISGKNPKIPAENSGTPEEDPESCGENPENCGENPKISGKNPGILGENPGILRESAENLGIFGENSGIFGERPRNVLEFRARLLYEDPLRSLPTDVELTAHGGAVPPGLFQALSVPRALRALGRQHSQNLLELPTGTG